MGFKSLFKSTRNEKRIAELESKLRDHISPHVTKTQLNYVENECEGLSKELEPAKKRIAELESKLKLNAELTEKLLSELEDRTVRIIRLEASYIETFKKIGDTFEKGMETLITQSAGTNQHILNFAVKEIEKATAKIQDIPPGEGLKELIIQLINERVVNMVDNEMLFNDETPEEFTITVNGEKKTVYSDLVSHDDIVNMAFESSSTNQSYMITYKHPDDDPINLSALSVHETIPIQEGTVFTITQIQDPNSP